MPWDRRATLPRPRFVDADTFAHMGRTVLDVLRRAGGPVTLPEVARGNVALRGLDTSSGAVLAPLEGSTGRALSTVLGTVRNPRKEGGLTLWELAG